MAKSNQFGGIDLLSWKPDADQKKALKSWFTEELDWVELLYECVVSGMKLSASYSNEYATFYVTMTCKNENNKNYDKALTVRHGDLQRALGALLWLHVTQPEAEWHVLAATRDNDW